MRTIVLLVFGVALATIGVRAANRRWPDRRVEVLAGFTAWWALVTVWNLATGLSHGYSLGEELPIQVAVFSIPVAVAWGGDAISRRRRQR